MGMLDRLRALLTPAPRPPVLLRVHGQDGPAEGRVEVSVTWYPSRARTDGSRVAAGGLCLVPWRGSEARAEVRVRTPEGVAELTVDHDPADAGRVREIRLSPWPARPQAHASTKPHPTRLRTSAGVVEPV